MSKYLKDLITDDLKKRLEGVSDVLVVDIAGLEANKNVELRKQLRQKGIKMLMVNRSNGEARAMTERCFGYPHF